VPPRRRFCLRALALELSGDGAERVRARVRVGARAHELLRGDRALLDGRGELHLEHGGGAHCVRRARRCLLCAALACLRLQPRGVDLRLERRDAAAQL
jgi:hypothetical protein